MKAVFADTFYWIALSNPAETRHRDALAFDAKMAGLPILTTDEVLSELVARAGNCGGEGLTDILTNDRHFEQEGFRALFRDS